MPHVSADKIPSSLDATLDRQIPSNGEVMPGVSIAHGEVKIEDASPSNSKAVLANSAAAGKRKVRDSITRPDYADAESSGDDLPLVSHPIELERNSARSHDN
jgi:hypothetical protein